MKVMIGALGNKLRNVSFRYSCNFLPVWAED